MMIAFGNVGLPHQFNEKWGQNEQNYCDPCLAITRCGGCPTNACTDEEPGQHRPKGRPARPAEKHVASVEAMPAEKFNYKPTADQMTFGHLVVHIAGTNDLLCSKAADVPAPKVDEVKETDSKDKLVAVVKASFDFCSDALAKMDDSRLAETTEIFPGRQGSRAWASMILAGAWADHYAEAAMYLRLNGVLLPTAKK
jgi:hypothetical protein